MLVAGDLVGYYYQIDKVLEMLGNWEHTMISGNHERMLHAWVRGENHQAVLAKYGSSLKVAENTLSQEQIDFLISLPITVNSEIAGRRFLLCHGTPWDADQYAYPDMPENVKNRLFSLPDDLIVYGHTHYQAKWECEGKIVVNPGSVGQQRDRIPGACWALWDTGTHVVSLHREAYDVTSLLAQIRMNDPELDYLSRVLTRTS